VFDHQSRANFLKLQFSQDIGLIIMTLEFDHQSRANFLKLQFSQDIGL